MMAVLIGNLGQFKRINWVKLDTTFNQFTLRGDLGFSFDAFDFVRCSDKSRDPMNENKIKREIRYLIFTFDVSLILLNDMMKYIKFISNNNNAIKSEIQSSFRY